MDIKSILRTTFAVPVIKPEWQNKLLLQLATEAVPGTADQPSAPSAATGFQPVSLDMGQGSREQQYKRQRPLLRIVPSRTDRS